MTSRYQEWTIETSHRNSGWNAVAHPEFFGTGYVETHGHKTERDAIADIFRMIDIEIERQKQEAAR